MDNNLDTLNLEGGPALVAVAAPSDTIYRLFCHSLQTNKNSHAPQTVKLVLLPATRETGITVQMAGAALAFLHLLFASVDAQSSKLMPGAHPRTVVFWRVSPNDKI